MKRFLTPLLIAFLIAGFLTGLLSWWMTNLKAVSSSLNPVRFVIPRGRSASEIGENLYREGLVRSSLAFKIYVQVSDRADKIQAGEYTLSPHLALVEIVDKLVSGPEELWVTIPEGLRKEEVVVRFINSLEMSGPGKEPFRQEFLKTTEQLEGYLFPDTYLFPRDVPASLVVDRLTKTFSEKIEQLKDEINTSNLNQNQIVTLASIVERETKTDAERPVVAGILLKRLGVDWPLQTDATVQYAIANVKCQTRLRASFAEVATKAEQGFGEAQCDWWPILTKEDLEINSPYNTYKFTGLPSAPIASPGLSSIEAVVNPQDSAYWYYIHDKEGKIHYARTLEEHNENIRVYLRR